MTQKSDPAQNDRKNDGGGKRVVARGWVHAFLRAVPLLYPVDTMSLLPKDTLLLLSKDCPA
jgi:hypothetical protein